MKSRMAISIVRIIVACLVFTHSFAALSQQARSTPLGPEEARAYWGAVSFDAEKFRAGSAAERAAMVADLIASNRYVGKPLTLVREQLGRPNGHYENDAIPAYILGGIPDQKSKAVWQVVFLPDARWVNVREVVIREN